MIDAKCFVSDIITYLCPSLGCRHLSLATTPTSTLGETSFASQVLPKGSVVGFCWCVVVALNPGSAPMPTNGSVVGT
jgi:hypothetical protein